jgi:hypothetical protein
MIGLAAVFGMGVTGAAAMPIDSVLGSTALHAAPVRLVCNPSRCIDPRTGAYTQSTCGRGGCRPLGGIVGYTNPGPGGYGGGRGYRERRYGEYDDDYGPSRRRYYYERY